MKFRPFVLFLLAIAAASCSREIEIGHSGGLLDSQDTGSQDDTDSQPECVLQWLQPPAAMANARAIWAASDDDVVVTGLVGAAHFDGTKWRAYQPEIPGATAIWGETRKDLWLGWPRCRGAGSRGCRPVDPLLLRASKAGIENVDFGVRSWNDVWVSSSGDAVAVGDNGRAAIRRGGVWQSMDTATTKDLYAVWGHNAISVIASGGFFRTAFDGRYTDIEGGLWHWDGNSWSPQDCCGDGQKQPRLFVDVHGNFLANVYLLSNRFFCTSDPSPLCEPDASIISHWEGGAWRDDTEPLLQEILTSLWSSSSSDVYAAGGLPSFDDNRVDWSGKGSLYHYDTVTGWVSSSLWVPPLVAVGGSGPGDVTLVGKYLAEPLSDPAGTIWTSRLKKGKRTTFEQEGALGARGGIWYRSRNEIYMVGPLMRRLLGDRWVDVDVPGFSDFSSVSGNDTGFGVAVTSSGQIAEYRNEKWKEVDPGAICDPDEGISGIWGRSSRDVYVVCKSRHIFRFDGNSWNQLYPGIEGRPPAAPAWSMLELVSVRGFDDGSVFFGGSVDSPSVPGVILTRHEEGGWTAQVLGARGPIRDIWGRSATDVYAVGHDSLLHFDGSSWAEIPCPENSRACRDMRPRAIFGDAESVYIASGDCDPLCTSDCKNATPGSGVLLRYDGEKYEILAEAQCFFDVVVTPSGRVLAITSNLIEGPESAQVLSYTCPTTPE